MTVSRLNWPRKALRPLHARLRSAIQAQITDGTLGPKEALPSERSLEEQTGVSRTTIRQALRGLAEAGLVKPVVGAGSFILERRDATPEAAGLVGVVVPDRYFYVYYAQLASAINNRLREAGYRVDMSLHDAQTENLARIVDGLLEQGVAGVVLCPTDDEAVLPILQRLAAAGVALVMIARFWDYPEADYVGADNERIGYEATRHLIELGHTGIVHLTYAYGSTARGRAGGYVRAMLEARLTPADFPVRDRGARRLAGRSGRVPGPGRSEAGESLLRHRQAGSHRGLLLQRRYGGLDPEGAAEMRPGHAGGRVAGRRG